MIENTDHKMRQFEMSENGRVWPCCYFATDYEMHKNDEDFELKDSVLDEEFAKDPDWNNAFKYGFQNVAKHEMFWTYLWDEGWDSDNPPTVCVRYCKKHEGE